MSNPLPLSSEVLKSLTSLWPSTTRAEQRRLWELLTGIPKERLFSQPKSLERYCPHAPWPKQNLFLQLDCLEAFYGGAAAGGKSEALLMGALQYVHVPGYSALILRKDTQRLRLSGGLIPRAHQWLSNQALGQYRPKWKASELRWTFPTGAALSGAAAKIACPPATLSFGYLATAADKYRYGSSEYQYIAFDELTEFSEEDYLFLFSRLRKTRDLMVPLRMRAASNPGNLGHAWVKGRFISDEAVAAANDSAQAGLLPSAAGPLFWKNGIAYLPARIVDNPAVNEREYRQSLANLPTILRERLMQGDWSISESALLRPEWLRYFSSRGEWIELLKPDGRVEVSYRERDARRLATIDPAGTSADKARERKGKPPSWSVICIWDIPPREAGRVLVLRHVWRKRVSIDELCQTIRQLRAEWQVSRILIENEKFGIAVHSLLKDLPIQLAPTKGQDKIARAAPLLAMVEQGHVYLPRDVSAWRGDLEAEWLSWTGHPDETSDQIDAAAYAALEVQEWTAPRMITGLPVWNRGELF